MKLSLQSPRRFLFNLYLNHNQQNNSLFRVNEGLIGNNFNTIEVDYKGIMTKFHKIIEFNNIFQYMI
jgi:hypothetical protein